MFAEVRVEEKRLGGPRPRWASVVALVVVWWAMTALPVLAANPPPVQVFYVPAPEDQVFAALSGIFPGKATCELPDIVTDVTEPIINYISISVIAEGTIVYYDHWEDGFEIDISAPTQATTQIWGDGNPANGAPPNIPGDLLGPNAVIVLRSNVTLATRASVIDFDGGDKLAATRTVAMTRATWDSGAGTLQAGALEVYPVDRWGTSFRAPVGVNSPSPSLFEYTAMMVMAADDGTQVQVDADANGSFETVVTLDEGESYLTATGVRVGARVQASAPVQVGLITGDICETYEARWYVLYPEEQWSDTYYSPVSAAGSNGTTAFLYNPNATPLTVTRSSVGGGTLNTLVGAGQGVSVTIPAGSGARFAAPSGQNFVAIAAVDSTGDLNSKSDWGFTLIPEDQLTMQTLIGWGAGQDPDLPPTENGSPVWVIGVNGGGPVDICVDYDGDAVGPLTDANGFAYDVKLTLNPFQAATVFDPDGDQTNMLLYVCSSTPNAPVNGRLAAAWGQDPDTASAGAPALDLGTTAPPAATFEAGKGATLLVDVDGDGKVDAGDSLRYAVIVRNAARVPIAGVTMSDTVPLYTTYLTGTTTVDLGSGATAVPDAGSGTPFPLDDGGIALGTLPVRGVFTVSFAVQIDAILPDGVDRVRNVAVVKAGGETRTPEVETPLDFDPTLALVKTTNGVRAELAPGVLVRAGAPVTWTYTVSNTGPISLTTLSLTDNRGVTPTLTGGATGVFEVDAVRVYAATGVAVAGQYSNTATAVGTSVDGEVVTATAVSHYFGVLAGIGVDKRADASRIRSGETVTYTYVVSSTGNVPLGEITLVDDRCAGVVPVESGGFNVGDLNSDGLLDVGENWRYSCASLITTTTTNIATVSGVDPLSTTVTATATATVSAVVPAIDLTKVVNRKVVQAGATVVYTFTVQNSGEDQLRAVELTDDQCSVGPVSGDVGGDGILELGESWRYTCTRVIEKSVVNVATVTALDSFGKPVSDTASAAVVIPILYIPIVIAVPPTVPCPPPDGCPLANEIKALAVNASRNRLYVVARNLDELLLVEPHTTEVLARAATGAQPWGIAVDEANARVYVSAFAGGDVRIYDANTLAPLKTLAVGDNPTLVEYLPGSNTIFVLVRGGSRLVIIEGLEIIANISTGGSGPYGIAADAVNQRIFISHRDSQSLTMVRKVNGAWQSSFGPLFTDGRQLFELAYDGATNRLFVIYADAQSNWFLDVWEPQTQNIWGRFSTQAMPSGGAIGDPDVGGGGLALNPTTQKLFNVNTGANSLSVIDGVTLGVVGTVNLGNDPFALALDSSRNTVFVGLRESGRLIKLDDTY
jgi:uncharacterized repeat protein (TIGR01451 family)